VKNSMLIQWILLLDWWESPKYNTNNEGKPVIQEPGLIEWLATDRDQMRYVLNELAFNAHESQPEIVGTADIKELILFRYDSNK
jgi:hypothetical protein